jgi:hypothetical protein
MEFGYWLFYYLVLALVALALLLCLWQWWMLRRWLGPSLLRVQRWTILVIVSLREGAKAVLAVYPPVAYWTAAKAQSLIRRLDNIQLPEPCPLCKSVEFLRHHPTMRVSCVMCQNDSKRLCQLYHLDAFSRTVKRVFMLFWGEGGAHCVPVSIDEVEALWCETCNDIATHACERVLSHTTRPICNAELEFRNVAAELFGRLMYEARCGYLRIECVKAGTWIVQNLTTFRDAGHQKRVEILFRRMRTLMREHLDVIQPIQQPFLDLIGFENACECLGEVDATRRSKLQFNEHKNRLDALFSKFNRQVEEDGKSSTGSGGGGCSELYRESWHEHNMYAWNATNNDGDDLSDDDVSCNNVYRYYY